nr:hypothetical protein [Tanacetum cinerariifolium]
MVVQSKLGKGAEQVSGNIATTQFKATPNESSSQGTDSGGGSRRQETIGDTTAQTRVESSDNEESLGENASKQGRIEAINTDEYITLVNDQDDANKDMFDVNVLGGEEVFAAAGQNKNSQDNGKGIMIEEPVKPKKKDQIRLDEEAAKRKKKRAREELIQKSTKNQKVEDDKEKDERKQLMETIPDEEKVAIDAISLAVKSPRIVDWKIHKEGKKSYYQIIRADGKSQMYMFFKDEVWKKQQGYKVLEWKLYASCGVHFLRMQSMMLVEKNLRSKEVFGSIILVLIKLLMKILDDFEEEYQVHGRIVGIKSLLDAVGITDVQVCVNAAQLELVLLVNFNEKYTKCLLILL